MAHDVYICYDEKDIEMANKVYDSLEKNRLRCWSKNRDAVVEDSVGEITDAIDKAKAVVLIYSKDSKDSTFVNNEIDTAFEKDKPIQVLQIDDTKLEGGLEFFLRKQPWIDAHDGPEAKFDELAKNTKKLVGNQIVNLIKDNKKPIIVAIIALIVIVGAVVYMSTGEEDEGNVTDVVAGDVKLKITDFHVDDVSKEDTAWNYAYTVEGTISPTPPGKSMIVLDFYDKTGKLVETKETQFRDAQTVSSGYLFGSTTAEKNDIKLVDVQLMNGDDIILAQDYAEV